MSLKAEILARYADRQLPRYTSYPTAPHFTAEIDAATHRAWLAALPADDPVSLYLHLPFCRAMCWYCGCNTSVTTREEPVLRYLDSLEREIAWVADAAPAGLPAAHVHFGGGTPSLIPPDRFVALMRLLRDRFRLTGDAEVAIEIDPRTLDEAMVAALAEGGVNRASLGVQSFDPAVQRAINRVQSLGQTHEAVTRLRAAGINGLSFDLIYGLPHQTTGSCRETALAAAALGPDRLSVFGYAHVPGFKQHQRRIDEAALPGARERFEQAEAIAEVLADAGYVRIGLDHFARPEDALARAFAEGRMHRNFQGYTTDACATLIGFGASSIGRLPQGYLQNAPRVPDYQARVAEQGSAVVRGCRFQGEDLTRAAIIERLMCDYRADMDGLKPPEELAELESDGLVRREGNVVAIPDDARPLVRVVAAAFDEYLGRGQARHSRAV
ncbi:oxygen-independent coproporphyrinogen III oxidase [Sphingomonas canadensis]|uniref:Coproporphyrinogen-III oxidase n=1 Tax=Sphingomonas canadensis TaxID=1219257 RepID=A0ABW3H813_9SPHN|nr:oxygen-independent coproporphyrinogen III oxidase [Sphingomonas canadensis]MCW3836265.1 oxygen-independent coproporphyrinogen III oxidase [Sphingomonas canadensis]